MDEIAAITGRPVQAASLVVDREVTRCQWYFGPKPGEPADLVTGAALILEQPGRDADYFNAIYGLSPQDRREPDVGDGAYWDVACRPAGVAGCRLEFLLGDRMYYVDTGRLSDSEAEVRALAIAIAEAAIPRL